MARANPDYRRRIAEKFMSQYQNEELRKSFLEFHKNRETMLIAITNDRLFPLKKIRNLKYDALESFDYVIGGKFKFWKEPYNIYYSCARYKNGIPIFYYTGDSKEIVKQRQTIWKQNCHKEAVSFDMALDVDSPDFKSLKIAAQDTARIYKKFAKKHDDVSIRFSGCGFHLVAPNCWKGEGITDKDIMKIRKEAEGYKKTISDLVDTHVIEPRRVIKTPGTLVYKEGYRYIMKCKIISFEELENFNMENYIYEKL